MANPDYPEHAKLAAVSDESNAIGAFLDESGYLLAEYVTFEGHDQETLVVVSKPITDILAAYFDIDLAKIEEERRDMLEQMRSQL